MGYRLAEQNGESVAVPRLVFAHLARADGDTIRAALYLLGGGGTDPRTMARDLGMPSIEAAKRAMQYWAGAGLLVSDRDAPLPKTEMQKASAEFQTRVMSNPKLEDRKLLAENLEELVSDRKSVMEKLNANDKKIVENSAYWLAEQNEKILERYSYKEVMELKEKLNTSKDILDHFEFVPKTNIVKNLVRKEKQSFFAKTVDAKLEQLLQKGYVSIIKINCTEEQAIYELLSKTYFVNDITLYGCSNATPEMQQVIQFLQDRKRVDFGEVEVQ